MEEPDHLSGGFPRLSIVYQGYLGRQVTVSNHLKSWMVDHKANKEKISVCYYGIKPAMQSLDEKLSARALVNRRYNLSAGPPLVAFVGRLVNQKRPLLAAQVLSAFAKQSPNCPFVAVFAGDGPLRTALGNIIRESGIAASVHILGVLSFSEAETLMRAADVLLLPSQNEGIALVLYEAMSAGVYVIAADVGGQAEILCEDCGALFPPSANETSEVLLYSYALRRVVCNQTARYVSQRAAFDYAKSRYSEEAMGDCFYRALHARSAQSAPTSESSLMLPVEYLTVRQQANEVWEALEWLRSQYASLLQSHEALQKSANEVWVELERLRSPKSLPQLFFVRGHGKSGTNWISAILNLHPAIHSRGEFNVMSITEAIYKVVDDPFSIPHFAPHNAVLLQGWRSLYQELVCTEVATRKTILWAGDQSPEPALPLPLPPPSRVIYVVRDGRDVAVSWLFHLLRICSNNPAACPIKSPAYSPTALLWWERLGYFHAAHPTADLLPALNESDGQEILHGMLDSWVAFHTSLIAAQKVGYNILLVRYEDLHADVKREAERMFEFLRVDSSLAAPLSGLASPFQHNTSRNDFYRRGQVGEWKNYRGTKFEAWAQAKLSSILKYYDYLEA